MAVGFICIVCLGDDIFCVDLPPFWIYVLGLCFATVFRFVLQDCVSGPLFCVVDALRGILFELALQCVYRVETTLVTNLADKFHLNLLAI